MSKTINVAFTGGFHDHNEITIRATIRDKGTYLGAYISDGQVKKLQREFCGMASCQCGGVYRADMSVPSGWTATSEGTQSGGGIVAERAKS